MSMDLATILVLLVVVTGGIWLYDLIRLAPQRTIAIKDKLPFENTGKNPVKDTHIPFFVELSRSLFPIFLLVLILRSFLIEPFRIPSGSMMPTLLIGDFILVNKFSYGIRLPATNTKIFSVGEPQRGDIIVFRYPDDPSVPFIKRVIGIPGDHVTYHNTNKMVYINGEPVTQNVLGTYQGVGSGSNMTGAEKRMEHLAGIDHMILVIPGAGTRSPIDEMTVPAGHYFVMGDNRDSSRDSRYWGTVPEENLIGKAFFIWMNWDWNNGGVSWQRLGTHIR